MCSFALSFFYTAFGIAIMTLQLKQGFFDAVELELLHGDLDFARQKRCFTRQLKISFNNSNENGNA